MKILIIDQNDFQTQTRAALIRDIPNHEVYVIDNVDDLKHEYKKDKYDIVVIDFDNKNEQGCIGKRCLDVVDAIDPMQRVITLSASNDYSDPNGCEHCVSNHRRRRLNKPTPLHNLVRMIDGFDGYTCDHFHIDEVR